MLFLFLRNGYSLNYWINWIFRHGERHTKYGRRLEKRQKRKLCLTFRFILNPVLSAWQMYFKTGQWWSRVYEWKHYFLSLLLPGWIEEGYPGHSWSYLVDTPWSAVHWASSEGGGCRTWVYQHQAGMASLLPQPELASLQVVMLQCRHSAILEPM